jgi:hypothetical protein
MKQSVVHRAWVLAVALAVSGFGEGVTAQQSLQSGRGQANAGSVRLRPGFSPDPRSVAVVARGTIDARTLNLGAGCVGFVTRTPDYIVNFAGPTPMLRFYVVVPGAVPATPTDATLLVNTAGGGWSCNDDSYGGANPTVTVQNAPPGQYDVWVGAYLQGANVRGRLFVTQLETNHP